MVGHNGDARYEVMRNGGGGLVEVGGTGVR